MKKFLSVAVVVLFISFLATPAFACGSRHGGRQPASYSVCSVENCTLTGLHTHNGRTYSAHYYGDGHKYHAYCGLEDCVIDGYHAHGGVYCFGHSYNDGHDYHEYCDIAGCTLAGYHDHDGAYCFGHASGGGYNRSTRGGCR